MIRQSITMDLTCSLARLIRCERGIDNMIFWDAMAFILSGRRELDRPSAFVYSRRGFFCTRFVLGFGATYLVSLEDRPCFGGGCSSIVEAGGWLSLLVVVWRKQEMKMQSLKSTVLRHHSCPSSVCRPSFSVMFDEKESPTKRNTRMKMFRSLF